MNNLAAIVLSLAPPSSGEKPNMLVQFMPFLLIFGVFYFLVFAPMRKKQKKHAAMLQELKKGDRVVTSGGIHGTVMGVTDDMIQLRIADQIRIDVTKSAVSVKQQVDG